MTLECKSNNVTMFFSDKKCLGWPSSLDKRMETATLTRAQTKATFLRFVHSNLHLQHQFYLYPRDFNQLATPV